MSEVCRDRDMLVEPDLKSMVDDSVDYLLELLKWLPDEMLNYLENAAKSNVRERRVGRRGPMRKIGFMMRVGLNNYNALTVIDAVMVERGSRFRSSEKMKVETLR